LFQKTGYRVLLFLSFSTQTIADVVAVTIPILALSLHASPFEIGLLATSRGAVYAICPFIAGYALGKTDRRQVLVSATAIDLVTTLLFYFSRAPLELIVFRLFEGLALAIFWPTLESLIAKARVSDNSDPLRGFNISWGLGQMVGPIIAGAVMMFFDVRLPFLVVAVAAVANVTLIVRYGESKDQMLNRKDRPSVSIRGISVSLILAIAFLGVIASIFFAFFPVFVTVLGINAFELGIMLFLFGAARVCFFHKARSIKGGLSPRILLASLGFTLVYFGDRLALYAGVVVIAAALSLVYSYTLEHVLRGDDLSVRHRAGMFEGLLGIGSMVGPFLAGFIAEFSFAYTFIMVAVVSLFFAIVLRVSEISTHRLSLSFKLRDPD